MTTHGWYRASDGNWYFGDDPRPHAAPPVADGRGGWHPAVPLAPAPPPSPPAKAGWQRWHTALVTGTAAFLFLIVAVSGGGEEERTSDVQRRFAESLAPLLTEPSDPPPAPATAAPKPTPKPTTKPPARPATAAPKPPTRKPAPVRTTVAPPATDPHFGTCKEAIAAGYGPYREGVDEEYDWYTDRDSDGIVCER